jgi:hypothetical protein
MDLKRSAARMHIYLQGNLPLAWMLFILVVCSFMCQIMILALGPGTRELDEATNHWQKFQHKGQMWRAPAIVFEDTKFKGWQMPITENISDLGALNFRDISSMRVSKGVTVTLYSNVSWTGSEISIDTDVTYLGNKWNDRVYSIAIEIDPVTPHAVEFYRAGASMGLQAQQCPRSVVCSPDATLDAVTGSVYMAISNLMREKLEGLVGCRTQRFFRPDGRAIYGMLPPKVYYTCEGEHFILPAEAPGFYVNVPVPSALKRLRIETLYTAPRIHSILDILTATECSTLISEARPHLVKAGKAMGVDGGWAWSASMCGKGCGAEKPSVLARSVVARTAELLGINQELAEGLIVRRYEQGAGEEEPRHEWTADRMHTAGNPENRFATVFIFLNTVPEGGQLYFPPGGRKLKKPTSQGAGASGGEGVTVLPAAGNAVLMYNLVASGHMEGRVDEAAWVGAAPVVRGEKWVAEVRFVNRLDKADEWNKAARERAATLGGSGKNWKPVNYRGTNVLLMCCYRGTNVLVMCCSGKNWKPVKMKHGPQHLQLQDVAVELQLTRFPT